jgi:hypothetical protein
LSASISIEERMSKAIEFFGGIEKVKVVHAAKKHPGGKRKRKPKVKLKTRCSNGLEGNLWRECAKKRRYRSESEAQKAIQNANHNRPDTRLRKYRCRFCNGWHLTSKIRP